jgi:hypothetical protein
LIGWTPLKTAPRATDRAPDTPGVAGDRPVFSRPSPICPHRPFQSRVAVAYTSTTAGQPYARERCVQPAKPVL